MTVEDEHVGRVVGRYVVCSCGEFKSRKIQTAATYQWKMFRDHVAEMEQQAGQTSSSDSERKDQS